MNKKILPVLFCGILCALGILLLLFGLSEAARVEGDDVVPTTHMLLTIPGILGILSGFLCFTRKAHRTGTRFVLLSLLYTALGGFLIECIYFQFIYFGVHRPCSTVVESPYNCSCLSAVCSPLLAFSESDAGGLSFDRTGTDFDSTG